MIQFVSEPFGGWLCYVCCTIIAPLSSEPMLTYLITMFLISIALSFSWTVMCWSTNYHIIAATACTTKHLTTPYWFWIAYRHHITLLDEPTAMTSFKITSSASMPTWLLQQIPAKLQCVSKRRIESNEASNDWHLKTSDLATALATQMLLKLKGVRRSTHVVYWSWCR